MLYDATLLLPPLYCREEKAIELYKQLKMKCKSKKGSVDLGGEEEPAGCIYEQAFCLHQRLKPI